ncbi:MAG: alanine--tRNA ligase [Candidatus Saccharibacteria bacterium]
MTAQEVRKAYLEYMAKNGHIIIPRAPLVPENDPTTLFTGSGMQPLVQYFLGTPHPSGNRIADSQTCFRADDIDEVGDNRHTTFFEMLGNWSFGDYFKQEQLGWFFNFLTETIGLDISKLYVTCFLGDKEANVAKDEESANIWQELFKSKKIDAKIIEIGSEADGGAKGMQGGRIFYYDDSKNWWSRSGKPSEMPTGEPGGPDSEVFYRFYEREHTDEEKSAYGENCHPNCDCGQFLEIGNSVFMEFVKNSDGSFGELPNKNVDFGGGLERISAAANGDSDVFKISLIWPIVERLEALSGKKYTDHTHAMRVIVDHLRAGIFLATDGVTPSNKGQGYVMRRLLRRAIRYAFEIGIEQGLCERVAPTIAELYRDDFPEVLEREQDIIKLLEREEKIFRQTLRKGLREFEKLDIKGLDEKLQKSHYPYFKATDAFLLYDTYGFPVEMSEEEARKNELEPEPDFQEKFDALLEEQRNRSRTASQGEFKGGLADASVMTTKLHTAAHLLDATLIRVLGKDVHQKGANITAERLRFDFTHHQKVTPEVISQVEQIVNEAIDKDYPVSWQEEDTETALKSGAIGVFGHKYGEKVKVYIIGDAKSPFSREICGGPHVEHTGQLAEGGKKFKIIKEEASSAGVRRIKATLV